MSEALDLTALQPELPNALLNVDQAVLDALPVGMYVCDADGLIVRVNRKAVELWGRAPRLRDPAQRFCGSFRLESLDGEPISEIDIPMARVLLTGVGIKGAEAVVYNPDGKRWVGRVEIAPLRDGDGAVVGAVNCFQDVTREHEVRAALECQQRTFDFAMIASKMGTWRYTFADNICIYDENAQDLYGLTEARFLHDADGVKEKFHPDDIDTMWARVKKALDPSGDGRYDVEYRVKQRNGSWRWLSAWGLVEFERRGGERIPVAIAGASRDLTERKEAEGLQRLLINELNHRVKNTLAIVQSIAVQTIRGASDLHAAREALDARIVSLARAHDLLTERNWVGADISEVVARALAVFAAQQIECTGPAVQLAPKHTLFLSLALHELGTNATKYGALSSPKGRVGLRWSMREGELDLMWTERGGPTVVAPTHRGFGSRLLETGFQKELGGRISLEFHPAGLRCGMSAAL